MKPRSKALIFAGILLLLPTSAYLAREFRTSDGRKALPKSVTHVEEHLSHGFIGGDFSRLLKSRMPEELYSGYAKSLGLSRRFNPQVDQGVKSTLNMTIDGAPEWWNPPDVDSNSYFAYEQGDDYLRVLRYHEGCVYYLVVSW